MIGLVVETHCNYFAPLAFPQRVEAGAARGAASARSSVRYEIGLFAAGEPTGAARGHFVHVYVDRATRRPAALPPALLDALQGPLRLTALSRPRARPPRSTPPSPRAARCAPSCRTPVPRETIEDILRVAARAPSGTNTQPWQVYVLTGAAKAELSRAIRAAYDDPRRARAAHRGVRLLPDRVGSRPTSTAAARSAGTCTACSASARPTRRACTRSTAATTSSSTRRSA